jgi:hypothetical protein
MYAGKLVFAQVMEFAGRNFGPGILNPPTKSAEEPQN